MPLDVHLVVGELHQLAALLALPEGVVERRLRRVQVEHRHELVPQPVGDVRRALGVAVPKVEDGLNGGVRIL